MDAQIDPQNGAEGAADPDAALARQARRVIEAAHAAAQARVHHHQAIRHSVPTESMFTLAQTRRNADKAAQDELEKYVTACANRLANE